MSVYQGLIGKRVIVRANMAGVFVGEVAEAHADGITLAAGARQLHYWSAGGSCPQVAERGIRADGSRVTAPSTKPRILATGAQVVTVDEMTPAAWDIVQAVPVWTGGL